MAAVLLIALLLAASATVLAVRAATMRRVGVDRALARIDAYGYPADAQSVPAGTPGAGPLTRILEGSGGALRRRLLGGASDADVRMLLAAAGLYRATPTTYAICRLAALAVAGLPAIWLALAHGATPLTMLGAAVFVTGAWALPPAELRRRRNVRLAQIDRALPELVDFLVVTIEAGAGLGSALRAASTRFRPPLGDEIRLAFQEQSMGLSTEEALRNMLMRCETSAMQSFVRSIGQAETLGVSIGQILRGLAVEMRNRRRHAVEEQAHKAPVKIVFPLVFLILPPLFLIVLGPAAYAIVRGFSG